MKKNGILNIVGYIVICSQIFAVRIPILDTLIAGYSLKYMLFYFFMIGVISKWIIRMIVQKQIKLIDIFIQVFLFLPFFMGIVHGWGIEKILLESILFVMPVAIYAWCQISDLKKETYITIFLSTVIVGAVISVLVALRIVETNIWAAEGQLVRAAGAVDSTIFLGGLIMSYTKLFIFSDKKNKRNFLIISLIASIVGILFSQSRSRIAMAIMFVGIAILYNLFNKKSKFGNFKVIVLVVIASIFITIFEPRVFEQIINQVQSRFQTFNDVNIIYRNDEASLQIQEFLKHPFLGLGWGSRSQYDGMYVHNVYSAILMQGGLVGFCCFLIWMLRMLRRNIASIIKSSITCEKAICFVFWALLMVLNCTNAGIVLCGGYFMLMYVFLCDKYNYK